MFSDVLQQRIMSIMGLSELYTFDKVVSYKPEWSLNYELGAHWQPGHGLSVDAALFYIDCRNQRAAPQHGCRTGCHMEARRRFDSPRFIWVYKCYL